MKVSTMASVSYLERRGELETYFDRTAVEAWSRLTSDAPVSGIRATVRLGRDRMRSTLLDWLPADLTGATLLDAGCGTGALAGEAAQRGAHVIAIDLSPRLIELARRRTAQQEWHKLIDFRVGDFLDPKIGKVDFVVAMDSLIHYRAKDTVSALSLLAGRTSRGILFTFAPRTPALAVMHAVGLCLPGKDRAPMIEPVSEANMREGLLDVRGRHRWSIGRTARVAQGFYTSQAMELTLG